MSSSNNPRTYRFNTNAGVIPIPNSVPGVSSGRWGDFIIDDLGNLYYYSGAAWNQITTGTPFPPVNSVVTIEPSANAAGNGYNLELNGGQATGGAGNGGHVEINGGDAANGVGGNVSITAGAGSTDGGIIQIFGVPGVANGNGSPITLLAGDGHNTGSGGNVLLASGSNFTGPGLAGDVIINAGTNSAGGNGGNVSIVSGNGNAGNGGIITLNLGFGLFNQGEFRIRDATNAIEYLSVSQTAGLGLVQDNSAVPNNAATLTGTAGSFVIATGFNTFVLTNPKILPGSLVFATVQTAINETLLSVVINPGLSTATFTFSGLLGANTTVGYMIVNPTSL